MKVAGGVDVCYNVQVAVDEKHKLIVAHDVTNAATDRDYLSPMAKAANEVLDSDHLQVIADMGYYNGPEITACLEAGMTPTVPGRVRRPMRSTVCSPRMISSTTQPRIVIGVRRGRP